MKVILAYSGGLDTSVMIKWLQEKYGAEVVTVTLDVGQGEDLALIEERARKLGVVEHYSIDAKEEFVENYVFPAVKANAMYEGKYPVSTALSRPLIAKKLVEVAEKHGADAVAHGCTGKGNDQVRIEVAVRSLNPDLKVIAPVREWGLTREAEIEYARKHGVPVEERRSIYSVDQNLWGRSIECGPLEDPAEEPPEEIFEWTLPLREAPDQPGYVSIKFERGVPVELNGERLDGVSLIARLNKLAGMHGVGRIDHVEDRLVGIKSREVYECPAALCILEAHRDLEKLVLTKHELMFKELVDREWAHLVYTGLWADPLREDLEAFINSCEDRVEGEVRLKLFKGSLIVVGRSSPYSLYEHSLATYGAESRFDQSWSKGFIELWGLQSMTARWKKRRKEA
ncbi:MAG: argininosuccinate synthase [Thermoprotei archaeon]|nr:MAG: argininosuccinate synthase [Thermoprotei archaeon]